MADRAVAEPLMGAVARAGRLVTMAAARATCRMWHELLACPMACRLGSAITGTLYTDVCDPRDMTVCFTSRLAGHIESNPELARWATRILAFARPRTRPQPRPRACAQPDGAATLAMYAGVLHPGFAAALLRHVDASGPSLPAALRAAVRAGNVVLVESMLPAMLDPMHSLRALDGVKDPRIVGIIGRQLAGALDDALDDDETFQCLNDALRSSAYADDAVRDALAEHLTFPDAMLAGAFRWAVDVGQTGLARWIHGRRSADLTPRMMCRIASDGHLATLQWAVATFGPVDDGSLHQILLSAARADELAVVQWLVGSFGLEVHRDHCAVLAAAINEGSVPVAEWILRTFPVSWRALAARESRARDTIVDLLDDEAISWRLKLTLIEGTGFRSTDVDEDE
jgi:hypothetical protein